MARTTKQVKKIWDRTKAKAKDEYDNFKPEVKKTGGGPAPTPLPDETAKVLDLIRGELEDTGNPYDCDASELPPIDYVASTATPAPVITVTDSCLDVVDEDPDLLELTGYANTNMQPSQDVIPVTTPANSASVEKEAKKALQMEEEILHERMREAQLKRKATEDEVRLKLQAAEHAAKAAEYEAKVKMQVVDYEAKLRMQAAEYNLEILRIRKEKELFEFRRAKSAIGEVENVPEK
ncbi:hypothetical protein Pmani_031437 [Petrolisthes manimaculis]|uniref:Uncharacterized protein n=1 Tax=Petrolisthes manimaculis TaxID=1843537 RepID=A0AAE1NV71_9EUCA|nr:hypothetical protein Pmani_031437 [Petrolisthes manimaculis]